MNAILRIINRVTFSFILVLLYYQDALAYIDPSAGSFFFQLIISGIISGLMVTKIFWKNIKSFLARVLPVFHRHARSEQRHGGK